MHLGLVHPARRPRASGTPWQARAPAARFKRAWVPGARGKRLRPLPRAGFPESGEVLCATSNITTPRARPSARNSSCRGRATLRAAGCGARRQSDSFFFSCWRRVIGRVAHCHRKLRGRGPRSAAATTAAAGPSRLLRSWQSCRSSASASARRGAPIITSLTKGGSRNSTHWSGAPRRRLSMRSAQILALLDTPAVLCVSGAPWCRRWSAR